MNTAIVLNWLKANFTGSVLPWLSLLVAVGFPILLEYLRRPRIDVVPQPGGVGDERGFRFLHVQVYNRPRIRRPLNWVAVSPLPVSRVLLEYFRTGERLFANVQGIWTNRPRPVVNEQFDSERANEAQALDLFASDQPYPVPVAIKLRGQEEAYGFHAESYRYDNRCDPNIRLPSNAEVELRVRIMGGGPKQRESRFRIQNFGRDLQAFVIERLR